jgi:hypothetical protein
MRLVTEQVFEQVQTILDAHAGSGTREHTHDHYLKGLLWCARCKHRMMVQRTLARSGEGYYYYFFCSGRRKGLCDLPYIPVEVLEEAVVRYSDKSWPLRRKGWPTRLSRVSWIFGDGLG